jgi:hypothetical protein
MDAPVGTLLAYATAPGKLAADGAAATACMRRSLRAIC